jgi:LuxR family maltose regulon positive regulatory protein
LVYAYPFLLEVQAWAAYVEGRPSDMEDYLDRYFAHLPRIVLQNPDSIQTSVLLRLMDHRKSLIEAMRILKKMPFKLFAKQVNAPSITQNMPLFHRSGRDFSEFACCGDTAYDLLRETAGFLFGDDYDSLEDLLRAGFLYEQGDLNAAYELAVLAHTKMRDDYAPEVQFCSHILLANILDAQNHTIEMEKILKNTEDMIERHKAYYLLANFRAFSYRLKFANGDVTAAGEWLQQTDPTYKELSFYKLYQHFTTARAYIAAGDYNMAILLLKKLRVLCEQYRRPLDIIEADILLAIAFWKKPKGTQNDAFEPLKRAIIAAREFGYTQIFINEGADLTNMLHRLQKRVIQSENSEISTSEIKGLYYSALQRAKHVKGLTGGRPPANLKFTQKQETVMRHLNEGLTQNEIAAKMGLKPSSIKVHVSLIYKKLDVSNITDAIIKMRELNAIEL